MVDVPVQIKRISSSELQVLWSDGLQQTISSETLRKNCPCAFCREKRGDESHSKPIIGSGKKKMSLKIIEHSLATEISMEKIWAVGTYAIGIKWGDGHDDGIYSYEFLKQLVSFK